MKNQSLFISVLALLLVAGGSFFAGTKYQESKRSNLRTQFGNNQTGRFGGQFPAGANRSGFRPIAGEIISADDKSITVKLQDGSSKIILLSDKTEINKAEKATKTDLKTGVQVAVFGNENSDGSITAQNIQLNPQFGRMRNVTPTPRSRP
ncbi:hypothetical protein HY357_03540 [Candidatus Roizmanbacteria bacterium]|nr:hypothetical protein [Candidatus Roizmanbacteria bacterium]